MTLLLTKIYIFVTGFDMNTVYGIQVDVMCILILLMIHVGNSRMALLHKSMNAFQRLIEVSLVFNVLNTIGALIPMTNFPAQRIINCLKVITCVTMGNFWFLTVYYTISTNTYKLKKWALPIILPSIALSIACINDTLIHFSDETVGLNPTIWIFLNIFSVAYIVGAASLSLRNALKSHNPFLRKRLYAVTFVMSVPLISMIAQAKYLDLYITAPTFVLASLFIYLSFMHLRITVDSITGLNNTNKLAQYLEDITQSQDPAKRLFFIRLKVDNLKEMRKKYKVSSTYFALNKVGQFLRTQCTCKGMFLAYYGRGSFAIVAEYVDFAELEAFTGRLIANSNGDQFLSQVPWPVTFSIYWSEYGTSETRYLDQLLKNVDKNCIKPPTPLAH